MAEAERHSALLGRAREIAELRAALDEAERGAGRLVLIQGEAGIGKTRLADEVAALARARGHAVYWSRCHELSGAPPFWPWAQLLRDWRSRASAADASRAAAPAAAELAQIAPEIG